MTWDWFNTGIVALIFAAVAFLEWADRRDLFVTALYRLRLRCSRRVPVGRYRVTDDISCRVGHPDTTMVFKIPLPSADGSRPVKYVAATQESTRFAIGERTVTLDDFLEGYDDSVGPLVFQVVEVGKVSELQIETDSSWQPAYGWSLQTKGDIAQ